MFSRTDNGVKFSVDRDVYSDRAFNETLSVFRPRFKIKVEEKEDSFEVFIMHIPLEVDVEEVALEFYNFLLSNENDATSSRSV